MKPRELRSSSIPDPDFSRITARVESEVNNIPPLSIPLVHELLMNPTPRGGWGDFLFVYKDIIEGEVNLGEVNREVNREVNLLTL